MPWRGLSPDREEVEGEYSGRRGQRHALAADRRRQSGTARRGSRRSVRCDQGAEHPVFERRENELHCTLPINVAQAVLGAEIEIETFDGPQQTRVPEGTQPGSQFRIRNLGVPL